MPLPGQFKTYSLHNRSIDIYVPDELTVQHLYRDNKNDAYWAQVWPASVGLCLFLEEHPHLISNKHLLELAAGLGLPGLYAAHLATHTTITDKEPLAETFVKKSAHHLALNNVTAKTLNWIDATKEPLPDVMLMSDVNYEPALFEQLKNLFRFFLHQKVPIIVSTPQRLVAKDFIVEWIPYCSLQWNCIVPLHNKETGVSIFVLEEKSGA